MASDTALPGSEQAAEAAQKGEHTHQHTQELAERPTEAPGGHSPMPIPHNAAQATGARGALLMGQGFLLGRQNILGLGCWRHSSVNRQNATKSHMACPQYLNRLILTPSPGRPSTKHRKGQAEVAPPLQGLLAPCEGHLFQEAFPVSPAQIPSQPHSPDQGCCHADSWTRTQSLEGGLEAGRVGPPDTEHR